MCFLATQKKYELFSEKEAAAQLSVIFFMALFLTAEFQKFRHEYGDLNSFKWYIQLLNYIW